MYVLLAIQLMMALALIIPAVLLWRQSSTRIKRISKRLLALLAAGVVLAILTTKKLTYDPDKAGQSAAWSAREMVKEACGFEPDVVVQSVEELTLGERAPDGRTFDVRLDILRKGNSIGEVYMFVSDNIKILGIPIRDNDVTANTVRCR